MNELKRYNLVVTEEMYAQLEQVARKRHTSVVEILRRYIKLGLIVEEIDERPGAELLIREGARERQIVFL
ncbi:MAG: ribbon-helix-helix protein, CopG family [Chloroflexota bacterium]